MRKQGFTIDWTTGCVTMTKKFAKAAGRYRSREFRQMMEMNDCGFSIDVKQPKKRKACATRITYKQMERYLSCLDDSVRRCAELRLVIEESKSQNNPYEHVRKWFLETYPSFGKTPVIDKNLRVVPAPIQLVKETEELKKDA